jgi:hypothetical protein
MCRTYNNLTIHFKYLHRNCHLEMDWTFRWTFTKIDSRLIKTKCFFYLKNGPFARNLGMYYIRRFWENLWVTGGDKAELCREQNEVYYDNMGYVAILKCGITYNIAENFVVSFVLPINNKSHLFIIGRFFRSETLARK